MYNSIEETFNLSFTSLNTALLLQPIQIVINILFIPSFIVFDVIEEKSELYKERKEYVQIQAYFLLILSIVYAVICFTRNKSQKTQTTPPASSSIEMEDLEETKPSPAEEKDTPHFLLYKTSTIE